jgi:hypothetical protein
MARFGSHEELAQWLDCSVVELADIMHHLHQCTIATASGTERCVTVDLTAIRPFVRAARERARSKAKAAEVKVATEAEEDDSWRLFPSRYRPTTDGDE